ncbi:SDR family NAD(P)-dependent oxidoreductase [Pseudofrankia inefficax]|uniref:Short-chain dehydrogenase/reductase SDR n=1 Tax=Pseudofrankia inefficax (strain DSM 45817 / CECT 9037 / DDB 130130 / EuI1c) TaxID=298654 RepID=E3J6K4_PSEI1|nr:SDR family oxidoreductase [Pseudofrankia inefficax]ADP80780.1 short-chain dehydrogenase/reductase SDR [Pseudofrankia inefficax]
MKGLTGKRLLVAGGARGIGAATARQLALEGAHVYVADLDADGATAVAREIQLAGGAAESGRYDLYAEYSIGDLISDVARILGGLDGVANVAADTSAALQGRDLDLLRMDVGVWEETLRANLIGTGLVIRYALPHLFEAGGGVIVNVTSDGSLAGEKVRVAYGASKAALNSLTRHVARTYGDRNVRANAVSPGAIMSETALATFDEKWQALLLGLMPLRRPGNPHGQPADIAQVISFLMSDDANWITGQVWSVNGGSMMRE